MGPAEDLLTDWAAFTFRKFKYYGVPMSSSWVKLELKSGRFQIVFEITKRYEVI